MSDNLSKSSSISLPKRTTTGNTAIRVVSEERNQTLLTASLSQLEIGDSLDVSGMRIDRLRVNVSNYGKRHNKWFSVRQHGNGYRCWRIAKKDRRQSTTRLPFVRTWK